MDVAGIPPGVSTGMLDAMADALRGGLLVTLAVLGLAVIMGRMGVVNLAHGATMMVGALMVALCERAELPVWVGIALAPVAAAGLGWLVDRCLARSRRRSVADVLLVTWAVALIVRRLVDALFAPFVPIGPGSVHSSLSTVPVSPVPMHPAPIASTPMRVTWLLEHRQVYLWILAALAIVSLAFAVWWGWRSARGLMARAALRDRHLAARSGIDVERLDRHAFTVGSMCAGMAGALLAPMFPFDAAFGADWLLPGIARLAGWMRQ